MAKVPITGPMVIVMWVDWVNGKRNGQGTYYFSNGNHYVGGFVNNKRHGQGIFYYINGNRYTGEWDNGKQLKTGTGISLEDVLKITGTALGVAGAIRDIKRGSSSGGSGGTVYNNPSKKGTGGGRCSGGIMTGTCSCWNPCCQWYWSDDGAGGLSRVACSSK